MNIFYILAHVSSIFLNLVMLAIITSMLISWFEVSPGNRFVALIYGLTEPLYRPFRRLTYLIPGPFDFAPMIVMFIITILQKTVPGYLMSLALANP